MKFIAEISITPTSFELASLNFVRINFNPSFKMRAEGFVDNAKYQGAMISQEQFPKVQILSW